jgi:hypothetical protein
MVVTAAVAAGAAVVFSALVLRPTVVAHSPVSLGARALPAAASVGAEAVAAALAVPVGAEAIAAVAVPVPPMVAASALLTQVAVAVPLTGAPTRS